ncbi:holo-ACP synthase [Paenibacillus sp. GCM10027626]|uniref:holo-ACP synthase n=1 Tax=Paenibacillus sp. GCM10027626 TaxID=3273411 RepID=UPI003635A9D0
MIIGIGHDIASIARIEQMLLAATGEKLLARILTEPERARAGELRGGRLAEFVAGRFAAKEAISKAFGCGIGRMIGFDDMTIGHDAAGKPECQLSDPAYARLGIDAARIKIHLTITHEEKLASAFAVIEQIG